MAKPTLSRTELAGLSHEELVERYFVLQNRARHLLGAGDSADSASGLLSDSAQRFRDFAETSSHWFWEMGPDLRFTYISDSLTEFTGESSRTTVSSMMICSPAGTIGKLSNVRYPPTLVNV